ncbi:MAG: glycoside hydrolase family 2 TIM barrel-domain containing protein [Tepidisphaeraceae bacterium]|jgi:beta-galactosidase
MRPRTSRWSPIYLAVLTLFGCQSQPPQPGRIETLLDTNWRFLRQDASNAQSPQFDDSNWQPITLPHTWNALDGIQPGNHYYRGPAWYRLHLISKFPQQNRQTYIRFDAASLAAQVYVNGQLAGAHRGGFAAFCFNITQYLKPDNNLIAVRVDNSPSNDIPPLSGDFTIFGGLYRDAHLLNLAPVCISPTDDASPGVYLTPNFIDQSTATITATVILRNDDDRPQTITVICQIAGVTASVAKTLAPHSTSNATLPITLSHPHLWNGRADPYLYQATVQLIQSNQILDEVTQPLGLRYFRLDPDQGFILNSQSYPLHGVGVHQDYYQKGWAVAPADIDTDYRLIDELGANAVRLAHYQHSDYEYSLCDRRGIVVWAEVPLINRIFDSDAFDQNAKQQLRELIKQNYNHPSICFWSLFNELGPRTRTDWRLPAEMAALAHQLDPTRPTVAASHLPPGIAVNWIPDTIAFNRYFGWYTDSLSDWPNKLATLHAARPDRAIAISEYGAGASIHQHVLIPTTEPDEKSHWHPEEYQSQFHESAYGAMEKCPWLWGTFVWNMFDFASSQRNEGDVPGYNDKGLVTSDRKTKKDAFYYYKAHWSDDPFVYITSRRFTPRPAGNVQIKIYSNCLTVQLFLNGRSLGPRTGSDDVFIWQNVPLSPGQDNIRAIAEFQSNTYQDFCQWTVLAPQHK